MDKEEDRIDSSVYRYILKHTRKDQLFLLLLTGLTMPLAYAALELPKMIINEAITGNNIPDTVFGYPVDQVKYLMVLCAGFFLLILINGGLTYVYSIYRGVIGEKMLKRFRFDLYSRLLRFPVPHFKQVSQAEVIPLITAETQPLGNWIGNSFALPVFQGGLLLTYLFFIFNQDVWLGLAAILLYPPQLYIIPKIQQHINDLDKDRVQTVREFSNRVGEAVSGIRDIHTNDMSRYEKQRVTSKLGEIYGIRMNIVKGWFLIKFLNTFLGQLTPFFFYAIGGYFVIMGELSIGALVAVLAAYKDLDNSWRDLLGFYQITENIRVRYGQIIQFFHPDNILDAELQTEAGAGPVLADSSIKVSSLGYSEDGLVKSLDGVSFEISPGSHIGLLGPSGSGRSDLTQLMARLMTPTSGAIKIADQNISELSESNLSGKIAYVDQQSFVFNGSIRDNLFYGLRSGSGDTKEPLDNRVMKILEALELDKDILQFGLKRCIDPASHPELSSMILDARSRLYKVLEQPEYQELVDILAPDQYNTNLTVAENLVFGMPVGGGEHEKLLTDKRVEKVIQESGLKATLFDVGLSATRVITEMFSDIPEDSPMFSRFDFIQHKDLPHLEKLSTLPESTKMESLSTDDTDRIMAMVFKLTVARHRLGLITPEIQGLIVDCHLQLRKELGEDNDLIEFYDSDRIALNLSIQDNILFGRVAYGQANAQQKVLQLIMEVIGSSEQIIKVAEVGFDFQVGVGGSVLTSKQRQKVTLARAMMKNPDILLVNEATAVFEKNTQLQIMQNILNLMRDHTVVWVLDSHDFIDNFDKLLVLDQGKLAAEGSPQEIEKPGTD